VREGLRVRSVVSGAIRESVNDTVIPLSKPFLDKKGVWRNEITMKKGDSVFVPVISLNKSKEIWGEDAGEFRPERWASPPERSSDIPSVFSHIATFLGGPRACIGYRFAVVEMKALLFMLVRDISFELAVPADEIDGRESTVIRPFVVTQKDKGSQLPLILRAVRQ